MTNLRENFGPGRRRDVAIDVCGPPRLRRHLEELGLALDDVAAKLQVRRHRMKDESDAERRHGLFPVMQRMYMRVTAGRATRPQPGQASKATSSHCVPNGRRLPGFSCGAAL